MHTVALGYATKKSSNAFVIPFFPKKDKTLFDQVSLFLPLSSSPSLPMLYILPFIGRQKYHFYIHTIEAVVGTNKHVKFTVE